MFICELFITTLSQTLVGDTLDYKTLDSAARNNDIARIFA